MGDNRCPAQHGEAEAGLDGHVRYTRNPSPKNSTGADGLRSGFGHNMGDSPMVVVWPSRGLNGTYDFVTLSQRKAPYETMPTPDPNPPFAVQLVPSNTTVRLPPTTVVILRVSLTSCVLCRSSRSTFR
jgi:hypothetical protein